MAHTSIRLNRPLTDDEINRVAPSIFATEKHESRSERYTYIPTIDVLSGLRDEGFQPFMACQTRVRDESKRAFTKHMIRLRHTSQIVNTEANEIVLLNSHDGSSSYQILSGVFRFVCMNGMVCGDTFSKTRIRHQGQVVNNVIEGAFRVLEEFDAIDGQIDAMKSIRLNEAEQGIFAKAALSLKYDPETKNVPITENHLLRPKRSEDCTDDIWTTFNRVQENMLKGGIRTRSSNGRVARTREVTGIDQNVKLNRALWILAEQMCQLKTA